MREKSQSQGSFPPAVRPAAAGAISIQETSLHRTSPLCVRDCNNINIPECRNRSLVLNPWRCAQHSNQIEMVLEKRQNLQRIQRTNWGETDDDYGASSNFEEAAHTDRERER
eukprot:c9409_g1_i1 orf=1-333(-)